MDFLKNTVLVETGFGEQQGLITVVDKAIGQADAHKADGAAGLFQYPGNFRSGSADQHILFDADQQGMFRSQLQNQFAVDGFDKAHAQKKGAATVYGLTDGSRFVTLKAKPFTEFVKAAIAFGGLDKTLQTWHCKATRASVMFTRGRERYEWTF